MGTANLLDAAHDSFEYSSAVYAQQAKVDDPKLTPSGQIMELVDAGSEFIDIAKDLADKHQIHFTSLEKDDEFHQRLVEQATASLQQQQELEAADEFAFDEFLDQYNNS